MRKQTCSCATTLLYSQAVSTLGSHSVRKETCSGEKTAAFSRREHTWISFSAQKDMFHRKGCCVRTPLGHLDLSSAKRHVPAKRLLRSHAASTLGSRSCAKGHVPCDTLLRSRAASQDRCLLADARSSFYSQPRTGHLRYREPVTRNPSHRAFALQIVDPISVYAVGEYWLPETQTWLV